MQLSRSAREPKKPPRNEIKNQTSTAWLRLIGNNQSALDACCQKAAQLGFNVRIANNALAGDAADAAAKIVQEARRASNSVCLLFGGETTVKVAGSGVGGRNQHLALAAALELHSHPGITLLAAGTDGSDGPTDAAGAIVDFQTVADARALGLEAAEYLHRFDSHSFFRRAGGLLKTGPTQTNVADIVLALTRQ